MAISYSPQGRPDHDPAAGMTLQMGADDLAAPPGASKARGTEPHCHGKDPNGYTLRLPGVPKEIAPAAGLSFPDAQIVRILETALHDLAKIKVSDKLPDYPGAFPLFSAYVWSLLKQQYGLPGVCKAYHNEIVARIRSAAFSHKTHATILYSLLERELVIPTTMWQSVIVNNHQRAIIYALSLIHI